MSLRLIAALVAVVVSIVLAGCGSARVAPGPAAPTAPQPAPVPPAAVVMIIRHGEKPEGDDPGLDADGREDEASLTATGWQRARGLVGLFDPPAGTLRAELARPVAIYAAGATDEGEGQRTRETVAPLADALGLTVNTEFGRGDERELARAVEKNAERQGATLISWQHGGIPEIVDRFPNVRPAPPKEWPDDRFDVVWVLTRSGDGWRFGQVPERVLPQDRAAVIDD